MSPAGSHRGPERSWAGNAFGCLAYLALFGALAAALDRWSAPRTVAELRPWLGTAAAFCFTMSLGALWGLVAGLVNRGGSRVAILERAAAGVLPDQDGVTVVTGTVRAAAAPLLAPLSGTPCAAYSYRMFYEQRNPRNHTEEVPVYWGLASRPFLVDTRTRAVRVMAVPWLVDDPVRRTGADAVLRARQVVAATRFEEASGMLGALGTALSTVRVLFNDDDGEHRADYKAAGTTRDPETLLLEETVLSVGATASLAGTWSADRGAVVPGSSTGGGVTVSTGSVDALLRRSSQVPPSSASGLVVAVVFGALGAAILWAGTIGLGPDGPFGQ